MSGRTEMASFGHFYQNFLLNQLNPKLKINHNTHLIPINNISSRIFLSLLRQSGISILIYTNPYNFHTFAFLALLLFFSSFFFFSFSSLLFSSPLFTEFALSFKTKNEIFCLSLIRPCLAIYNFVLLFGFLLLGPLTPLYLQINLFIFPLYPIILINYDPWVMN